MDPLLLVSALVGALVTLSVNGLWRWATKPRVSWVPVDIDAHMHGVAEGTAQGGIAAKFAQVGGATAYEVRASGNLVVGIDDDVPLDEYGRTERGHVRDTRTLPVAPPGTFIVAMLSPQGSDPANTKISIHWKPQTGLLGRRLFRSQTWTWEGLLAGSAPRRRFHMRAVGSLAPDTTPLVTSDVALVNPE